MRIFLASLGFAALCLCLVSFGSRDQKTINYLGQRCPHDMEFIPGNGNIPSFFMGKSEETNLDYVIYLDWLQRVYVYVPQVFDAARPHEVDYDDQYKYNDPVLQGRLRNPAFAYYPVTDCDWLQIQDYLAWKTDRLNEAILVRDGYLKLLPDQTNADNYNTEAFLAWQYDGLIRKKRLPKSGENVPVSGRNLAKNLPFLSTGYRLPTEEEWEYATRADFQNHLASGGNRHPYGKKFFLFDYASYFDVCKSMCNYIANSGMGESMDMNGIKSAGTYKTSIYGIFNMGDNVEEWLLDTYTPAVKHYANSESIYTMNGFKIAEDGDYKNSNSQFKDKDSTGLMPYRIMGFRANGDALKVMRYSLRYNSDYIAVQVRNPDSAKIKAAQLQMVRKLMAEIEQGEHHKSYWDYKHYGYPDTWLLNLYRRGILEGGNLDYYRLDHITLKNGTQKDTLIADENLVMNSKMFVAERDYMTVYRYAGPNPNDTISRYRVVKTGTWKNPSTTARRKMKESEASANVGFRVVIPYYGMPVNKKDMVKWNKKANKYIKYPN
jgi:formylglycine-generating enzyme required for sulfatase activity